MSYLFFADESGHDHRNMPYEVRGGIALHASALWEFIKEIEHVQRELFGDLLASYNTELKGHKLLDKDRFKWAAQAEPFSRADRQQLVISFLDKGRQPGAKCTRDEFSAYGQASLLMADAVFRICRSHGAVLFASAIPRGIKKTMPAGVSKLLRKDYIFLYERLHYFLEEQDSYGVIVMDQTSKQQHRVFVDRMERYFSRSEKGSARAKRIVPVPFFVSSDLAYPIQVADVCIYCINWAFRLQRRGMDADVRKEISSRYLEHILDLQYSTSREFNGDIKDVYGIVYVGDPYENRQ